MKNSKGFTLIELMIVVAIIGILAAIAIPNFLAMQLRAKRAELPTNVDAIRTAEKSYEAEWDVFTACAASPSSVPSKTTVSFGHTMGDGSDWDLLGWMPDGLVRGQYEVNVVTGTSVTQNFTVDAYSDIDGDGTNAHFTADKHYKASMVTTNDIY